MSAKIIFIFDYYDGPLSGIIDIDDLRYLFVTPFNEDDDDYENYALVYSTYNLRVDLSIFDQGNDNIVSQKKTLSYATLVSRMLGQGIQSKKMFLKFVRTQPGHHEGCFDLNVSSI